MNGGSSTTLHETLHQVLDGLAEQDLSELCDAEVHELTVGLARARNRVDGVLLAALDVWDARGIWSDDGSKSPAARLAREANWSKHAASLAVRRARALRRLPATAEAVTTGDLSAEFVDLVDTASEVPLEVPFTDCEPAIVKGCIEAGFRESRDAIRRWIDRCDPDRADERDERRFSRRGIGAAETIDGLVHVSGDLAGVGGHEWLAELQRLESIMYRADLESGTIRTARQRRADAMVEMARRSATLDASEMASGTPARVALSVVMGLGQFEHLCELAVGTPIAPGELVPLLDRLDIERMVFDMPERVLSVSRQRAFPAAVRRAIEIRDRRCTHSSGCDEPAEWCDTDHVAEYSRGGLTCEANGRLHCRTHNRNHTLRQRSPEPGAPRTQRPPRGWIPGTPNLGGPAGDDGSDGSDGSDDTDDGDGSSGVGRR
jgi:hypothetical protein